MLPSPPEEVGTVMMLFTRQNKDKPQLIEYNNVTTVLDSNYNASQETKLIIQVFGPQSAVCTSVTVRVTGTD